MRLIVLTLFLLFVGLMAFAQTYEEQLTRDLPLGTVSSVVNNEDSTGNTSIVLRSPSDTTSLTQTPDSVFYNSTSALIINSDVTIEGEVGLPNLQRNFNVAGKVHMTYENMGFLLEDSTNFMGYPISGSGVYGTTDTSFMFEGYHRQEDLLGPGVYNHLQRFYLDSNFFYIGNTLSPIESTMFIKNDQRVNGPTVGLSVERDPTAVGPDSTKYKARLYTNLSPGVGNGEFKLNPVGGINSTATTDLTNVNHIIFENHSQDTLLYLENSGDLLLIGTQTVAEDVYVRDNAFGVIIRSPDNTCYRIVVANGGALSTNSVTCP